MVSQISETFTQCSDSFFLLQVPPRAAISKKVLWTPALYSSSQTLFIFFLSQSLPSTFHDEPFLSRPHASFHPRLSTPNLSYFSYFSLLSTHNFSHSPTPTVATFIKKKNHNLTMISILSAFLSLNSSSSLCIRYFCFVFYYFTELFLNSFLSPSDIITLRFSPTYHQHVRMKRVY